MRTAPHLPGVCSAPPQLRQGPSWKGVGLPRQLCRTLAHLGRSAFVIELPGCPFRRLTIELGDEGLPSLPVAVDAYRRTDVCGRGQLACVIWATALDTQTLSHNETAEKKDVALTC